MEEMQMNIVYGSEGRPLRSQYNYDLSWKYDDDDMNDNDNDEDVENQGAAVISHWCNAMIKPVSAKQKVYNLRTHASKYCLQVRRTTAEEPEYNFKTNASEYCLRVRRTTAVLVVVILI